MSALTTGYFDWCRIKPVLTSVPTLTGADFNRSWLATVPTLTGANFDRWRLWLVPTLNGADFDQCWLHWRLRSVPILTGAYFDRFSLWLVLTLISGYFERCSLWTWSAYLEYFLTRAKTWSCLRLRIYLDLDAKLPWAWNTSWFKLEGEFRSDLISWHCFEAGTWFRFYSWIQSFDLDYIWDLGLNYIRSVRL